MNPSDRSRLQTGVSVFGSERIVVRAVHLGSVQGSVSHAVYWLRSLSAAMLVRRVGHHHQHAQWSNILRLVRRPFHINDPMFRHLQTNVH